MHIQKGSRPIVITHSEWNNLIYYIPKILENLDPGKDVSFCDENLYVTTRKPHAHKYVRFHRGTGDDHSGVNMTMNEWGEFVVCC